jgi:4-amino-4-deoxy-L-arabinose transferase-like glycosyltransferase
VPNILVSAALIICILAPGPFACYLAGSRGRASWALRPNLCFIALLFDLMLTSVFSLLLFICGRFGGIPLLLLQAAVSGLLLVGVLFRRKSCRLEFPPFDRGKKLQLLLLGLFLLGGLALRLPPSFYVDGGQDQGVYVNLAAYYLRHGGPFVEDPWLARARAGTAPERSLLGPFYQPLFAVPSQPVPHRYEDGHRLPGFYMADPAAGRIVPQFFPLHPLWMAIFWQLFGPRGSVYSLTFFALLALLAVYYCGRELFPNPGAGLIALAFLAINLLQVWVNRYPVSETLAQFWLFSGLYLFLRGRRANSGGTLTLAAVSFGLYALTRFPAMSFLPIYVLAFWLDRGTKKNYLFYNLLLLGNIAALVYGTAFSFPYLHELVEDQVGRQYRWSWEQALLFGGVALALVNLVKLGIGAWWEKLGETALRNRKETLWIGGIFSLLALAIRTLMSIQPNTGGWTMHSIEPLRFFQFSWYLTWPGVIIALAGIAFWWRDSRFKRELLFPAALCWFSLFFVFVVEFRNSNQYYQFYYGRYFVSEVFPFCALGIGYCLVKLAGRPGYGRLSAGLLLAGLGVAYLLPYATNPAARVEELAGAYAGTEEMIRRLPPDSVTFIGESSFTSLASSYYHSLGTTLMFLGNRYVLPALEQDRTRQAMLYFLGQKKPVYFLYISETPFVPAAGSPLTLKLAAKGYRPLVSSQRINKIPRLVGRDVIPWWLYEITSLHPLILQRGEAAQVEAPRQWQFEAEDPTLRAPGGEIVNDPDASQGKAVKASGPFAGAAQTVISGPPHQSFPPGDYEAHFLLKITDSGGREAVALSVAERSAGGTKELTHAARRGNALAQYRTVPLSFSVTKAEANLPLFFSVTRLDPKVEITVDRVEIRRR